MSIGIMALGNSLEVMLSSTIAIINSSDLQMLFVLSTTYFHFPLLSLITS